MFYVGQKVVCVLGDGNHVQTGSVYEVEASYGKYLVLVGVCERGPGRRPGMGKYRFRPIAERKTDISIFTQMLTPSPQRVKELVVVTQDKRADG